VCTPGIAVNVASTPSLDTLLADLLEFQTRMTRLLWTALDSTRSTRPKLANLEFSFRDVPRSLSRQDEPCPECNHQLILGTIARLEASDPDRLKKLSCFGTSRGTLHPFPVSLSLTDTESTLGPNKGPLHTSTKHPNMRDATSHGPNIVKHESIPRRQCQGECPDTSASTINACMDTPFSESPDFGLALDSKTEPSRNSTTLDTGEDCTPHSDCEMCEHPQCDTATGLTHGTTSSGVETLHRGRQVLTSPGDASVWEGQEMSRGSLIDASVWEGKEMGWDQTAAAVSILLMLTDVVGGFFEWHSRRPCPEDTSVWGQAVMLPPV